MLGIILCNNNKFLTPLINGNCLLIHWYNILSNKCSNVIIITSNYNHLVIKTIMGENVNIFNNINIIKTINYNLAIIVNTDYIINNIDFNVIDKIKDNYFGAILNWNKIPYILIYKKEIENIILNNDFINNKHLFIEENNSELILNVNNNNDFNNYLISLNNSNKIYIKGTLIIVALYIGNIDQEKLNSSIQCLENLRKYYPDEYIIIVDNNSPNQLWIETANKLNMKIIKNTNEYYRFEAGAYNLALKYYKADRYLCIQHNINFNSRIPYELDYDKPDAYIFGNINMLCMNNDGLNIINRYLTFLNMGHWNGEYIAVYCCFYCNHLMMEKLLNIHLFDLVSNKKILSEVYERLIGTFLFRILNTAKFIDQSIFNKIFFNQQ